MKYFLRIAVAVLLIGALAPKLATGDDSTPPTSAPLNFAMIFSAGVAPCTIHVHALQIPLASGTPLTARYQWDFGDPSGRYNQLAGWNAAHIFEKPGKYTIRLKLSEESGAQRTFSHNIEIAPDLRRRIYVSGSGNDSNNGDDPQHPIRSVARVNKLIAHDTTILFHRGEAFDISQGLLIAQSNVVLSSYGGSPATAPMTSPAQSPR